MEKQKKIQLYEVKKLPIIEICDWRSNYFNIELMEETGVQSSDIDMDLNFRFEEVYYPVEKGERVKKNLVIFLGRLKSDSVNVRTNFFSNSNSNYCFSKVNSSNEHSGFEWLSWNSPPTPLQRETIDPLLEKVHAYLQA